MDIRIKEILQRCEGSILDIGCVQHTLECVKNDSWLHGNLTEIFNDVVGIDLLKEEVKILNKMGYNVIYANAEKFVLDEKFNTIVAGELIEHLSNPGNFLDSCYNHLNENGKLILTTPNSFWIEHPVRKMFGKLHINPQHTAWYDDVVLPQLAERHQFTVVEVKYIIERYKPSTIKGFFWHKMIYPILLITLPASLTAYNLLFVLKKSIDLAES